MNIFTYLGKIFLLYNFLDCTWCAAAQMRKNFSHLNNLFGKKRLFTAKWYFAAAQPRATERQNAVKILVKENTS